MKRTPLGRRTSLRPGKPLDPGRRPLARRSRLAPVSAKRRAAGATRARPDEPLAAWCEVAIQGVCTGRAEHRHHKLRRSQGGGDERANTLDVCARCHLDGIHANPAESYERGWLIRGVA